MRPEPPSLPDGLRERVLQQAARVPAPTRSQVRGRSVGVGLVSASYLMAVFLSAGGFRRGPRPDELVWGTAVGAGAIVILGAFAVLSRGRSVLGRSAPVRLLVALATPAALLAWKVGVSVQFLGQSDPWPDRPGMRCLELGTVMAIGPMLGLLVVLRGTEPNHPGHVGLGLGVMAASVAWVFTDLWCPVAHLPHLLIGHVFPMFAFGVLGLVIGPRWLGLHGR